MKLRYYQEDCITEVWRYFRHNDGNPIAALPTGTGKSLIIAAFIERMCKHYPGTRFLMLTHVKELIVQNLDKLLAIWPTAPAGVYSAGLNRRDIQQVTYAGIQSVGKKAHLFGHIDLILIDECHLVSPKQKTLYRKFIDQLRETNPKLKIIGLSATPYRLGQGMLTESDGLFTDVCYDITGFESFNRLVAEGYLAPLVPKRTDEQLDVSTVRVQGGEFVQSELQHAVDREEITMAALKEALDKAHDRKKWLVFSTGVEHAEHIVGMLDSMGVPALAVHSKMKAAQRDHAIAEFQAGRIRAIVNNNVLTTGFDCPDIDCIIVLRPTSSPGLWVQMLGRGTRPAEGKENCLVLDYAANTKRLGPINDPVIPTRRNKKGKGTAPVRVCESCGTYNHASARFCCECNEEFPRHVKFGTDASTEELVRKEEYTVEIFKVTLVQYARHTSKQPDKPDSLLVTYRCGLRSFNEWVCLEHDSFVKHKAREWWRERDPFLVDNDDVPSSIEEALERCDDIRSPTHLRVWVRKKPKFPEILAFDFSGTAFNTRDPEPEPVVDPEDEPF